MTSRLRPRFFRVTALLVHSLSLPACESDEPAVCRYAGQTALTENAASRAPGAALLPVGEGFVLAGMEGANVHWAPLSRTGVLGAAATFAVPETTVLPAQLAVTARNVPGDQLLAIYGVASAEGEIAIRAVTHVAGEAATPPATLATLPAGVNLADVRLAVGSSRSGSRALLAFGVANQPGTRIEVRVLAGDATTVGMPLSLDAPEQVRCLQFVPSRSDWALAWLNPSQGASQRLFVHEGLDAGSIVLRNDIGLDAAEITCPLIAPKEGGYLIGFQSKQGTFVAEYIVGSLTVGSEFVAPSVQFGAADRQPPLGGLAAMGLDAAVLFGVPTGPQVWLYDPFGARLGSGLKLPANTGSMGPVASWPVVGGLYTTYREGVGASANAGPRWFMRVECPRP